MLAGSSFEDGLVFCVYVDVLTCESRSVDVVQPAACTRRSLDAVAVLAA